LFVELLAYRVAIVYSPRDQRSDTMENTFATHTFLSEAAVAEPVWMCRPKAVANGSWNGGGRVLAKRSMR
jgi:hypothetical protein